MSQSAHASKASAATTPKHDDLVYDVGLHKGEDTEFYLKKGFRVVAFEADPDFIKYCRTLFADALVERRLVIVEGAIVDNVDVNEQGSVTFYKNIDHSVLGTVKGAWVERNELANKRHVRLDVPRVDFVASLKHYGIPYYMKVDIEGCDILCLKALLSFENKPNYISIESEKVLFNRLLHEFDLLRHLGYNRFKAIQQAEIPNSTSPLPAREGKDMPHQFRKGASGVFGAETEGLWLDERAAIQQYKRIFEDYRRFGNDSVLARSRIGRKMLKFAKKLVRRPLPGWYDTHAKHSSLE